MSSPACRASTSRSRVPTIYVYGKPRELDVISDSCLILGAEIASMRQLRAGADHLNTTQICRVSEWEVTSGRGSMNALQTGSQAAWPSCIRVLEGRLNA